MDKRNLKLFAIFCIELVVFMPVVFVSALTINNVQNVIEPGVVTVLWDTGSSQTNASFKYGVYGSSQLERQLVFVSEYKTNHSVSLTGLDPGMRYSYEIKSFTNSGSGENRIGSFTVPDMTPPPQPTGLKEVNVTENMARIEWDKHGIDDFNQYFVYKNGLNIANRTPNWLIDNDVEALTTYVYQVAIRDKTGNIGALSDGLIINTPEPDLIPPNIYNIQTIVLSNDSVFIFWQTNELSDSRVYFGKGGIDQNTKMSGSYNNHTVTLTRLEPNERYEFIIGSCDSKGNCMNSSQGYFSPGGDVTPPTLDIEIPELHNANKLDIEGTTEALARIFIYINDMAFPKRAVQARIDGSFATDIYLDADLAENLLKLEAVDGAGNKQSKTFTIRVDAAKPVVSVEQFPALVTKSSFSINGTVSEDVTLDIYIESDTISDLPIPSMVMGLSESSLTSDSVNLAWDANSGNERIDYYKIYRDSVLRGTADRNSFSDCINARTLYSYQVLAVNKDCVEGERSDSFTITSPEGNDCTDDDSLVEHDCNALVPDKTSKIKQGSFKQTINLKEGRNRIRLVFYDDANNIVTLSGALIYDTSPPRITWNNIRDLSPVYSDDVIIRGTVDENATVIITVNNDSQYIGHTDDNGNFSIEVELEKIDYDEILEEQRSRNQITGRAVEDIGGGMDTDVGGTHYTSDEYRVGSLDENNYYSYQEGNEDFVTGSLEMTADSGKWKNRIKIVAVDGVGRESQPVTGDIVYAMCSMGSYWGINLGEIQPGMLIPRHLLNGIAQITFSFDLEWLGGTGGFQDDPIPRVSTRVSFRDISRKDKDKWDTDWFSVRSPIFKPNTNNTEGYVILQAKKLDSYFGNNDKYRDDLAEAISKGEEDKFVTTYNLEENISDHRTGDCLVSMFGCVKLPLQIELRFTDPVFATGRDRNDNIIGARSPYQSTSIVQRQCWNVEIAIDKRIDPGLIPKKFLERAILFLNQSINAIDSVLVPINKIKEYTLYACLGSWLFLYMKALNKRWTCEFSGTLMQVMGKGFKLAIAEQGLCKAVYGQKEQGESKNILNEPKYNACQRCTVAIKEYNDFAETMQYICDRIACPSAPSFMKYVRDMQNTRGVKSNAVANVTTSTGGNKEFFSLNLESYSDCKNVELTFEEIALQYKRWKDNKGEEEFTFLNPKQIPADSELDGKMVQPGEEDKITCYDPHMPNSDCCVFEYMRTYDSVCGLWQGSLFDEMKESYCVAGQVSYSKYGARDENDKETSNDITRTKGDDVGDVSYEKECMGPTRQTWNALAGFCEKDISEDMTLINAHVQYAIAAPAYFEINTDKTRDKQVGEREREGVLSGSQITYQNVEPSARGYDIATITEVCPTTLRPHDDQSIYYRVRPVEPEAGSESEDVNYVVHRGIVLRNIGLDTTQFNGPENALFNNIDGESLVSSSMVFRPLVRLPTEWFMADSTQRMDATISNAKNIPNKQGYIEFKKDMGQCASSVEVERAAPKMQRELNDMFRDYKNQDTDPTNIKAAQYFADNKNDYPTLNNYIDAKDVESMYETWSSENKDKQTTLDSMIISSFDQNKQISDSYARPTYNKIRTAMGIGEKDEIVDPTSSFLRSVQCLCLPGVTGYLKLWRAIMTAVKACLQTILMTGDGNPGICQAVLSVYVCDLIYDAIRCFTQKTGTGMNREYGLMGFPGNLLGTLTSAGRDVERTIAGRYGSSSFFRAMFAERQLMHAVCLWFFTGTFDFDFNALVEGEYGDVPVDSQGLLSPCQRRYISYNPSSGGRVTWNYFFGVGLVAGAPLTYRVYLQCSDGYDCDYGYGREKCDCADRSGGPKKRFVSLRGAPGSLDRYDVLEESYDDVIQDDVRYDKVFLEYYYMDKDRDRVIGNVSCDIRTVGGEPPGFCQYDVGQGIYRCAVDVGMEDYALLSRVIDPQAPGAYSVNQVFQIYAEVKQKVPETLDCMSADSCPSTKFIGVELKDHSGNTVIDPFDYNNQMAYRPILIDGLMTYALPVGSFVISPSYLQTGDTGGVYGCEIDPDQRDSFVEQCSGSFGDGTKTLVLFMSDNNVIVKGSGTLTGSNDGKCKFNDYKGDNVEKVECEFNLGENRVIKFIIRNKYDTGSPIILRTVTLGSLQAINNRESNDNTDLSFCNGRTEVVWTGKVMIFDTIEESGMYRKSDNIYSYQGTTQELPFSIKIKCESEAMQQLNEEERYKVFDDFIAIANGIKIKVDDTDKGIMSISDLTIGNRVDSLSIKTNDEMDSISATIRYPGGMRTSGPYVLNAVNGNRQDWNGLIQKTLDEKGDYVLEVNMVKNGRGYQKNFLLSVVDDLTS